MQHDTAVGLGTKDGTTGCTIKSSVVRNVGLVVLVFSHKKCMTSRLVVVVFTRENSMTNRLFFQ